MRYALRAMRYAFCLIYAPEIIFFDQDKPEHPLRDQADDKGEEDDQPDREEFGCRGRVDKCGYAEADDAGRLAKEHRKSIHKNPLHKDQPSEAVEEDGQNHDLQEQDRRQFPHQPHAIDTAQDVAAETRGTRGADMFCCHDFIHNDKVGLSDSPFILRNSFFARKRRIFKVGIEISSSFATVRYDLSSK